KGMPDLNYAYEPLKQEIFAIGRFWLEELGIDGFRLDAARHIYFDSEAPKSHAWWQEFRSEMEKIKPDVYLVGEVWDRADRVAPYLNGLHASFNFDLGKAIIKTLQDERDSIRLAFQLKQIRQMYDSINPTFLDATFITNHDQNRTISELDNSLEKAKMAASVLLTLPGTPYIYYGEEIGMRGKKPDEQIREPFLWEKDSEDQLRARWIEAQYSLDGEIMPLSEQQKEKASLWQHYRDLIQVRKEHPTISQGTLIPVDTQNDKLIAYQVAGASSTYFVIHNISPEKVVYSLPNSSDKPRLIFGSEKLQILEKGKMELDPMNSLILIGEFPGKGPSPR
ncbi:MAG: alpha-amylase family glycosyl hydrolase, partial [Bacteroidota bacterium]